MDNKTITEAIIVFGSSKQRLYTAAELLKFGYAPLIFVAGTQDSTSYTNFLKEQGIPEYQFIFDPELLNNQKNYVLDIYLFTKKYKISSIRLVTNAEEMPRAMHEIRRYLTRSTVVIPHYVSLKKKNYNSIFLEYNKYLLIILAPILGLQNELSISYS